MDLRVARRYALALFSAAKETNAVEQTAQDLDAIAVVLKGNQEAKEFLESPEVDRNAKLQFVDKVFSDRARPLTMRLRSPRPPRFETSRIPPCDRNCSR